MHTMDACEMTVPPGGAEENVDVCHVMSICAHHKTQAVQTQ